MRFLPLLLLAGCGLPGAPTLSMSAGYGGTPPLVTARESATASMTLIACPIRADGVQVVSDLVQALSQQSPVVTASDAATARLVLNTCPSPPTPEAIRAAAEAARARR